MTSTSRTVLVGTSLTDASDEVVGNGLQIARAAGAKLHLVHAFDLTMLYCGSAFGGGAYVPAMIEDARAACRRRMEAQAARLGVQPAELAGLTALDGAPFGVLIETAQALAADLIVLGAADADRWTETLLGSTADRVIRAAGCPVLATRGRLPVPPRRALIAVDLSPASAEAMACGLGVLDAMGAGPAARPGAAVEVLYVSGNGLFEDTQPLPDPPDGRRPAQENLRRFLSSHGLDPVWRLRPRVRRGPSAAGEILDHCNTASPDLIVVGTHGRGGVPRLLLGSVAESVLRHARQSVLAVPPQAARASRRAAILAQGLEGA